MGGGALADQARVHYSVVPSESAVLIEARSTVGLIELASTALGGHVDASLSDGQLDLASPPEATITVPVETLQSGNRRYDREIHRRLDAQRYPMITARLGSARMVGANAVSVGGSLTIHGHTVEMSGGFDLEVVNAEHVTILGEQQIDIRDFSIAVPATAMLRIYPDVVVRFRIEAASTVSDPAGEE
jgi:polyisoprenoid-binding protein YceI